MKKHVTKNLAAKALLTGMFLLFGTQAYATSNPAPVATPMASPVGVANSAPINLNSNRPITATQQRRTVDPTSVAAHNARTQQQQQQQATASSRKIKSPFPPGFSGGFNTVTPPQITPEQAKQMEPEKPYVPPRAATSSFDEEANNQAKAKTGTAPTTPYVIGSGNRTNAAPYTAPSAYNGLNRR